MFGRWGQENFFKYLRQEYALDALVDYGTEPADASRSVPNPGRKKLDAELRQARAHLEQLQAHYGLAALENRERRRPTMRGFKIANAARPPSPNPQLLVIPPFFCHLALSYGKSKT